MSTAAPARTRSPRAIVTACAVGASLERYGFVLYGAAAALVFGPLFFPGSDPATATLLAFATYGVGFLARPLGGTVFGYFGDRLGRRGALAVALQAMGLSTFLIGILPTHASIGVAAPILLTLLRFVQGLSLGGEWGGAVLLSVEHTRPGRWGLAAAWIQFGVPAGNLAAVGMLALARIGLDDEAFFAWGWRLPFLAAAAAALVGLWIRDNIAESPLFTALAERPAGPLSEVVRTHRRALAASFLSRIGVDVVFYLSTLHVLTRLADGTPLSTGVGLVAVAAGSAVQLVLIPWFGALSDRWGRRGVAAAGAAAAAAWTWAFFPMVATGRAPLVIAAVTVALATHAAMYGPQAAFVAERFATRVRYSGASLGYQVAGIAGGALAPIAAIVLFDRFGGTAALSLYATAALALTVTGLAIAPRPVHRR